MSKTRRNAVLAAIASLAASGAFVGAPASAAEAEVTEDAAGQTLASGTWSKVSFDSKGGWSIVEHGGQRFVELDADFRTRNAPDLKIFLSPKAAGDLTGANATDGAVLVSQLTSNAGAQSYALPAGVDLDAFATIIIHCEQYSKLWSTAPLR